MSQKEKGRNFKVIVHTCITLINDKGNPVEDTFICFK